MVIVLSGIPPSATRHVDESVVLNGTAGVGANEQIHGPMNLHENGLSNEYNYFIFIKIYALY